MLEFDWGCGNHVVMTWKLNNDADNSTANGVCLSKSYLWAKRCLTMGRAPRTREEFDRELFGKGSLEPTEFLAALNNGVGVGPTSFATQALHAWGQRKFAKDRDKQQEDPLKYAMIDPVKNFNRRIAKGHGLIANQPLDSMDDFVTGTPHSRWLDCALGNGDGAYVFTVVQDGGNGYHHTMAIYISSQPALFDSEQGQFSCKREDFRDDVLEYMNRCYPNLGACDLWKPRFV